MLRKLATATLIAALLGKAGFAADAPTVKSIEVEVDLTAVQNTTAASYWGGLSEDLKNAIATRVSDQIADNGVIIKVDIEEVELSNGFTETAGLADTKLTGKVKFDIKDAMRFQVFDLSVDVNKAAPLLPAGTVTEPSTQNASLYYTAMVNAFAQGVVDRLK